MVVAALGCCCWSKCGGESWAKVVVISGRSLERVRVREVVGEVGERANGELVGEFENVDCLLGGLFDASVLFGALKVGKEGGGLLDCDEFI